MGSGSEGPVLVSSVALRFANAEPGRPVRILLRNYGENEHTNFSWHRTCVQDSHGRVTLTKSTKQQESTNQYADIVESNGGTPGTTEATILHLSEIAIIGGLCWGKLCPHLLALSFHGPKSCLRLCGRIAVQELESAMPIHGPLTPLCGSVRELCT